MIPNQKSQKADCRSNSGFTLVEVVVAGAIFAVIALGMLSMFEMNGRSNRNIVQQSDATSLSNLIKMNMNIVTSCTATVTGQLTPLTFTLPVPAAPIPITKVITGTVPVSTIATVGTVFGSVQLNAGSMSLQNFVQIGPTNYTANFVVNTSAIGSSLGSQNFARQFPVSVGVNVVGATATIISCTTDTSPTICTGAYPNWQCYRTSIDGTIEEWGVTPSPPTGGTSITTPITFPKAFTIFPSLTVTGGDLPDGAQDDYSVYFTGLSTTGATAELICAVNIGGSGCGHLNSIPVHWHAFGN
jgi:prepilin-type N-terminal cleavage/methylation domain-containing protein